MRFINEFSEHRYGKIAAVEMLEGRLKEEKRLKDKYKDTIVEVETYKAKMKKRDPTLKFGDRPNLED